LFFGVCPLFSVILLSIIKRALALVDAAAVESAAAAIAVRKAADATVPCEACVFFLLQTDALVRVATVLTGARIVFAAAGVVIAAAALELFATAIDVLLEALSADLAAFVVVEMENQLFAVEARLRLLSEVGTEEPLEGHEAIPEGIAVGRDEGTAVAVEVAVFLFLHVGCVGVVVADVAVRLPVVLILVPGGLVVLFSGRHL